MGYPPEWLTRLESDGVPENLTLLMEVDGKRVSALPVLARTVLSHLADINRLQGLLSPEKLKIVVESKLPLTKRTRSGLLGEILASEYIALETSYELPIRRLRWRDGRETSMRGDDLIAIERNDNGFKLLKGETKSRKELSSGTVSEAISQLDRDDGRPQPHTLAFIGDRLLELGNEDGALCIWDLMVDKIQDEHLEHCIFTLSGNDPSTLLSGVGKRPIPIRMVGLRIEDHQEFIAAVFEACDACLS